MKMTMHIDDALLKRVIAITGAANKTHVVDIASREVDRKAQLIRLTKKGYQGCTTTTRNPMWS